MKYLIFNWKLIVTDNKDKVINYIAIPPTNGNRIDIITNKTLNPGYNYNTDCIIIRIVAGKVKELIVNHGDVKGAVKFKQEIKYRK